MNRYLKKIKKKQKGDYLSFVRPEKSMETKNKLHKINNAIVDYLCRVCFYKFNDPYELAGHYCSLIESYYRYFCKT
jgi:hypothetical protein